MSQVHCPMSMHAILAGMDNALGTILTVYAVYVSALWLWSKQKPDFHLILRFISTMYNCTYMYVKSIRYYQRTALMTKIGTYMIGRI